jgi:hypothetical protein
MEIVIALLLIAAVIGYVYHRLNKTNGYFPGAERVDENQDR